jgi:inosine-uridine nucleoside N-ribohydrolase
MLTKQKWIIDTDPGFDDLMAILYLLNRPNTEVLMVSTVDGNVSINKTTENARKIVKWSGKNIPIYRGSDTPIFKTFPNDKSFFYSDGLGDIDEIRNYSPEDVVVEQGHAVLKMIELTEKYPNEINLLVIGPMTNLAVASMLHPDITNLFKNIYMMGGSITSKGNDNVCMGEFNFNFDYLATKVVFSNFKNIILTPWEPTENVKIKSENMETIEKRFEQSNKEYNKHSHRVSKLIVNKYTQERNGLNICDLYCAMSAFDNNCVTKFSLCKVDTMIDSTVNFGMLYLKRRKTFLDEFFYFKENVFKNEYKGSEYHLIIEGLDLNKILEEIELIY